MGSSDGFRAASKKKKCDVTFTAAPLSQLQVVVWVFGGSSLVLVAPGYSGFGNRMLGWGFVLGCRMNVIGTMVGLLLTKAVQPIGGRLDSVKPKPCTQDAMYPKRVEGSFTM